MRRESKEPASMLVSMLVSMLALACLRGAFVPGLAHAQEYRYNPANKVDPFLPLTLRKPTIRGLSRLQDYDISQLELVGTVLGAEITALILTPEPREGILAKIGDRVGTKGGRIIAIARDKVVVREPTNGLIVPGRAQKFVDVTMVLASRASAASGGGIQSNRASEQMGFPSLSPLAPGSEGRPPQRVPDRTENGSGARDPSVSPRSRARTQPGGGTQDPPSPQGSARPAEAAPGFAPESLPPSAFAPPSTIPPSFIPPSTVGAPPPAAGAPAATPLAPDAGAPTAR